jgi:hypothetical protein
MKINLIALTTLLVAALTARAQNNDRVITVTGDTIACQINLPVFSAPKYRTSKNEKAKKIKTDSVKEYYTADKSTWYRRVFYDPKVLWVRNKVCFMTVVESGKINLYELITSTTSYGANGTMYSSSNTGWYVSKGTDTAILIKGTLLARQKRKNEFADLLADNKTVYDKYMADDKFGFDEIRNLVHLYNTGEPYK